MGILNTIGNSILTGSVTRPADYQNDSTAKKVGGLAWALTKSIVTGKAGPTKDLVYDYRQSRDGYEMAKRLDSLVDSQPHLSAYASGKPVSGSAYAKVVSNSKTDIASIVFGQSIAKEIEPDRITLLSIENKEIDDNFRRVSQHLNIISAILGGQSKTQVALEKSINDKIYSAFEVESESKNQLASELSGHVEEISRDVRAAGERIDIQDREIETLRADLSRAKREFQGTLNRPTLSMGGMNQPPPIPGTKGPNPLGGGFGDLIGDGAKVGAGAGLGALLRGLGGRVAGMAGPLAGMAALGYGTYKTKEFFDGLFGVPDQKFFDDLIAKRDGKAPAKEKEAGEEKSDIHTRMKKYLDGVKERHKDGVKPDIQKYNAMQITVDTDYGLEAKQTINLKAAKIILDSKELIITGSKVEGTSSSSTSNAGGATSSPAPSSPTVPSVTPSPINPKAEEVLKNIEPKLSPGGGIEGAPLGSQGGGMGLPGLGGGSGISDSPSFGGGPTSFGGGDNPFVDTPTFGGSTTQPNSMPTMPGGSVPRGKTWNTHEAPTGGTVDPGQEGTGNSKKIVNVPRQEGVASVRYNNPGAAYPSKHDEKYGIEGYGLLERGKHKIGKFPTVVHGAAANLDLFGRKYTGMTLQQAVNKWRGGNGSLNVPEGFDPNMIVTPEFAKDREQMIKLFKGMAKHEAGRSTPITDDQWNQAFDWKEAGGIEAAKKLGKAGSASPLVEGKGGTVDPGTIKPNPVNPTANKVKPSKGEADIAKATGSDMDEQQAAKTLQDYKDGKGNSASVDSALSVLGLHEKRDRQTLKEYMKTGGVNFDPAKAAWCAAFVNASLAKGGMKGTNSAAAGSFHKWGDKVRDPSQVKAGDVVVNHDYSPRTGMRGNHVGIATGPAYQDKQGNWQIPTIEGNTGDKVGLKTRPFSSWSVRTPTENEFMEPQTINGSTEKPNAMPTLPQPKTAPQNPVTPNAGGPGFKLGQGLGAAMKTPAVTPPPGIPKTAVGKPNPRATAGKPMAAPGSINKPTPPGIPTGRGANPAKAMARKKYEDNTAARGGAPSGGGISGDAGRAPKESKAKPADAKASETAATKGSDVKGDTNIQVPRHNSGDSNPPAPGDDGTGSYDTTCFV